MVSPLPPATEVRQGCRGTEAIMPDKGKVERPYRYIREDFFLARSFRNLDDLNAQLRHWLDTVANPRVHATTGRVVDEAFAEEKPHLQPLPLVPFRSVLRLERRVSHEGMVSVGGNYYSVPDTTRRRVLEVHALADEIQIFEAGQLIARHPVLEGRNQRRVAPGHRKAPASAADRRAGADVPTVIGRTGDVVARRSLDFYEARRPAARRHGAAVMTVHADPASSVLDRIKRTLVGLRMPRALEMIDATVRQLERGEVSPLEAIETLLAEEFSIRENRRVKTALMMARLSTVKTLAGFDFAFQPSLDRNRVLALAQLDFVDRHEVVHLLGPPAPASRTSRSRSGSRRSRPAAASTSSPWPTSSRRWPRRNARAGCATGSASSAAPRS